MTYVKMVPVAALARKTGSLSVLYGVFTEHPGNEWYGYGLMRQLGWSSGKLYPLLARLEARGLVTSWMRDPTEPGRPPRRVYRLAPGAPAQLPPAE
jgi:PadR family transcriptional regulator PadR